MHVHTPGPFCLRSVSCSISYPSLPLKFVKVFFVVCWFPWTLKLVPPLLLCQMQDACLPFLKPFLALFYLFFLVLFPSVAFDSQAVPLIVFPQAGFSEKEGLSDHAASATPFQRTCKPCGQFYANLTGVECLEINEFLQALWRVSSWMRAVAGDEGDPFLPQQCLQMTVPAVGEAPAGACSH